MSDAYPTGIALASTPGTQVLFLDMLEVDELRNAQLVVNQARKHPANPVIQTGSLGEWDSLQAVTWHGTVIWDAEDRIYKAWYMGLDAAEMGQQRTRTGYAVSPDGVAWEKPALGIHAYNGSRDNNLVIDITPAKGMGPALKDLGDPDPSRRYKLFLWDDNGDIEIWNAPDGSKARLPDPDVWFDLHQCLYDAQEPDPNRRYKTYGQISERRGSWSIRKGGMAFGPDPWSWTRSPHNPIIDPDDGEEFQNHYVSVLPYKGYYLMLYEFGWLEPWNNAYVADVRLAVSRDGEIFRRVNPHQPVIRRGGKGEWDGAFIVTSSDPVVHDDQIHLYYAGNGEVWKNWPNENSRGSPISSGSVFPSQTGLATLPLDGFTNVESLDREMPGVVTTIPIEVGPDPTTLEVSVGNMIPGRSWLAVEVLGPSGDPLPGFAKEACERLATDGPGQVVTWNGSTELPRSETRFQLRFWTYGAAKLYGFSFVAAYEM